MNGLVYSRRDVKVLRQDIDYLNFLSLEFLATTLLLFQHILVHLGIRNDVGRNRQSAELH